MSEWLVLLLSERVNMAFVNLGGRTKWLQVSYIIYEN